MGEGNDVAEGVKGLQQRWIMAERETWKTVSEILSLIRANGLEGCNWKYRAEKVLAGIWASVSQQSFEHGVGCCGWVWLGWIYRGGINGLRMKPNQQHGWQVQGQLGVHFFLASSKNSGSEIDELKGWRSGLEWGVSFFLGDVLLLIWVNFYKAVQWRCLASRK